MLNGGLNDEVPIAIGSDATEDDSSTTAGYIIYILPV